MDRKLFIFFVGATGIGFTYTINRLIKLEKLHDALCNAIAEDRDTETQMMVDDIFNDITNKYNE